MHQPVFSSEGSLRRNPGRSISQVISPLPISPVKPRLKKSRSINRVRLESDNSLATATDSMVLPTPPLPLTNAITNGGGRLTDASWFFLLAWAEPSHHASTAQVGITLICVLE